MYDVIIIGAGPAGSAAALALAKNGRKVLLAEKFRLPREKSCSGILIKKTIESIETLFGEVPPDHVCCRPSDSRGMILFDEDGHEHAYRQEGLNIRRSLFDQWLALKAVAAGAEFWEDSPAVACRQTGDRVLVEFKGKANRFAEAAGVIVCEGAAGSLKKKILGSSGGFVTTYQQFFRGTIDLDPHYFYAFLQEEFSGYDAWFNIKDDFLICGVAAEDTARLEGFHSLFLSHLERRYGGRFEEMLKTERWLMPRIIPDCPVDYGAGRILFSGEAAGFLNPMGEGIFSALGSGAAAAESFEEAGLLSGGGDDAVLAVLYSRKLESLRNYMRRQWNFVAGISPRFSHMRAEPALYFG